MHIRRSHQVAYVKSGYHKEKGNETILNMWYSVNCKFLTWQASYKENNSRRSIKATTARTTLFVPGFDKEKEKETDIY